MKPLRLSIACMLLFAGLFSPAQSQIDGMNNNSVVPTLVNFSGVLTDVNGKPLTSLTGVTFFLYKQQQGGSPLWMETQNVRPDKLGHYAVVLGSSSSQGLPPDLFASGEARWLGVQVQDQAEQARVMLLSVPYALKAGDAETLGGKPASAFLLSTGNLSGPGGNSPPISGGGKPGFIASWKTTSQLTNSKLFQNSAGNLGVNTTTPAARFDINGTEDVRNTLTLFPNGTAPTLAINGTFFSVDHTGLVSFVSGQTFPNTGTITGVTAGSGLSGGGNSGNVTLGVASGGITNAMLANSSLTVAAGTALTGGGTVSLGGSTTLNVDTTKVPLLAANNAFTGNQTVNGNLSATGVVTGNGFQIGSNLFGYGSLSNGNAFLGFAGNTTVAGTGNTATGALALSSDSSGTGNTASGYQALIANTGGSANTASGEFSLEQNTTGNANTASGSQALQANTTGSNNTAIGVAALMSNVTGSDNTATGFDALLNNTTGKYNTITGYAALFKNTTGSLNTAHGEEALYTNSTGTNNTASGAGSGSTLDFSAITGSGNTFLGSNSALSTGTLNNATAIGADAEVSESNALVLGSINGVNGATASTNVGIGTTAPLAPLDVFGSALDTYIGSPGCNGNFAGIGFGRLGFSNCTNYALIGDDVGNLYLNTTESGSILFRNNNSSPNLMTIDSSGNVNITGNLSKGGGSFKIDHPLDPANKYLYHSFVESPDMMDVYNGNIRTDKRGLATVVLPDYFQALNRDFRYQLTVIGQFAQAIVIREIRQNRFTIKTSRPGVKVSWQVTGIRHDAYADAHRIPVEEDKTVAEQGHYLHPELFGASQELAIGARPSNSVPSQTLKSAVNVSETTTGSAALP